MGQKTCDQRGEVSSARLKLFKNSNLEDKHSTEHTRWHGPDLGRAVGSLSWFMHCAVLLCLIGGSITLGITALTPVSKPNASTGDTGTFRGAEALYEAPSEGGEQRDLLADLSWATDDLETHRTQALATRDALAATLWPQAVTTVEQPAEIIKTVKVGRGDTMVSVLTRAGVPREDANSAVVALAKNFNMRHLRAGQDIELRVAAEDESLLHALSFRPTSDQTILAARQDDNSFLSEIADVPLERTLVRAGGRIDSSLYLAMDKADVPSTAIGDLIHIFSWDVDFQREVQRGDRFEIFYEQYVDERGEPIKTGHVLFGSMTLNGKTIDLYRHTPSDDNRADYFHADGQSVRKALLRTPIDGARLTSRFGMRRHPILGYNKMHKGIDFGARTGTPIRAAGDGVVEKAGWLGGFGNYVRIRHNSTYKTAYAHLHKYGKGIKAGTRVRQGQIIGYVGSTGRSTGPHLHYEVHKNGKQVNPLGIKLPTGRKLEGEHLAVFQEMVSERNTRIAALPLNNQVASLASGE